MINTIFNMHHRVKLQLDAICQEAGDMNVEEFMQVYESLKQEVSKPKLTGIDRNFQEDMINDMDMGEEDGYMSPGQVQWYMEEDKKDREQH